MRPSCTAPYTTRSSCSAAGSRAIRGFRFWREWGRRAPDRGSATLCPWACSALRSCSLIGMAMATGGVETHCHDHAHPYHRHNPLPVHVRHADRIGTAPIRPRPQGRYQLRRPLPEPITHCGARLACGCFRAAEAAAVPRCARRTARHQYGQRHQAERWRRHAGALCGAAGAGIRGVQHRPGGSSTSGAMRTSCSPPRRTAIRMRMVPCTSGGT